MQDRPEATGVDPAREAARTSDEERDAGGGAEGAGQYGAGGTAHTGAGGGRRARRHRRGGGADRNLESRNEQGGSERQRSLRRPEPSLNMEELRELADLIVSQGFTEFELEREGFRVRLSRSTVQQGASHAPVLSVPFAQVAPALPHVASTPATFGIETEQQAASAKNTQAESPENEVEASQQRSAPTADEDLYKITSPIVGTFYRSPSPTAEPFVRVGSHVSADTVVCIIEAMKLMNEILAEVSGTVEKIYVENGQPVEYGQPLFGIKR